MHFVAEPVLQTASDLGEGAIWDVTLGVLHWVDIDKFLIHTFDPATGNNSSIFVGTQVGTVVKRNTKYGGGFIVGLPEQIAHVDNEGKVTALCEMEAGLGNRMNDGKCDPAGRFWCGSMNFEFTQGAANLWMLDTNGTLHHKLSEVTISNGLVWTSDRKVMYYIDTPTGHVDAFDYDVETGTIGNRRTAVQNHSTGYFDGMTIDAEDNIYVAIWGGGSVLKFNPRNGKLLATIEVPGVKHVTSCAFGGQRLQDLYITSSAKGTDPVNEPNAGALFRVSLADTQGVPSFEFQG